MKINPSIVTSDGMASDVLAKSIRKLSESGGIKNAARTDEVAAQERMTAHMRGIDQAGRDVQDAVALLQTVDGVLTKVQDSLGRMRDLALRAGSESTGEAERNALQTDVGEVKASIEADVRQASFGGRPVSRQTPSSDWRGSLPDLDASFSETAEGANPLEAVGAFLRRSPGPSAREATGLLDGVDARSLGVDALDLHSRTSALDSLGRVDAALGELAGRRAVASSQIGRLAYLGGGLAAGAENASAARSQIDDVRAAREVLDFAKQAILSEADRSLRGQANLRQETVLGLIQ